LKYDKLDHCSIWLETDEGDDCKHRSMILDISSITKTPAFTPHITLVGNIRRWSIDTIQNKLAELSKGISVFDVNFSYVFAGPRCLNIVLIFAKQNSILTNLYLRAEEIFEKKSLFYLPHLSLLYGKVPRAVKKSVVERVKESGIQKSPFTVNRISLWRCRNGVANWERKASIKLLSQTK
jgi:2'-5' RNA ligase